MPKKEATAGAPEWVVTYGDMMSLLLVFFIALVSMSELKQDKFQQAVQSLHQAFGGVEADLGTPIATNTKNTLVERLLALETPLDPRKGDTVEESVEGSMYKVTSVPEGLQVVVGGPIAFDRFDAELRPEARELISRTAGTLRGYNTRILVRGHATNEPLPPDSAFQDRWDLSYARAKAVLAELKAGGVDAARLVPVAVGDAEPVVREAYTEERRSLNRRVELLVTEDLVDDHAGEPAIP